jgi:hypothetical protein
MRSLLRNTASRRMMLIAAIAWIGLAGCSGADSVPVRVAYKRQIAGQFYAIELRRDFTLPTKGENAAYFKQSMPLAWDQLRGLRDGGQIDRLLADFNENNALWQLMPKYQQDLLWRPQFEPPI